MALTVAAAAACSPAVTVTPDGAATGAPDSDAASEQPTSPSAKPAPALTPTVPPPPTPTATAGLDDPPAPTIGAAERLAADPRLVARLHAAATAWSPDVEVTLAVAARDGETFAVDGDRIVGSASAAKAYWAAAALAVAGVEAVEPYAYDTFRWSDNDAAGRIIDLVGVDELNQWLAAVGMEGTNLISWSYGASRIWSGAPGRFGGWNHTTAIDAVTFLSALASGALLGPAETEALLGWMRTTPRSRTDESPYGGVLPDRLPRPARDATAHKGGWLPPPCCGEDREILIDIGVIPVGDDDWVAVSFTTSGGDDYDGGAEWMAWAACEVHRVASGGDDPADCGRLGDPQPTG